ncbi:hypothetical protein BKI52_28945 [marine bacterium AO1-C]|nr:hypothetical protein BKI52_28945 [marine bacterium AO1-C]
MIKPMKKTLYHIYEGLAILVIVVCFWVDPRPDHTHTISLEHTLESAREDSLFVSGSNFFNQMMKELGTSDEFYERLPRFYRLLRITKSTIRVLERHKIHIEQYPKDARDPVNTYFIQEKQGYKIKQVLDAYVDSLSRKFRDFTLPKFEKLLTGNKALYQKYEWFMPKDIVRLHFGHATVAEASALLTTKQYKVFRYALSIIKGLRGYSDIYLDYGCGPIPVLSGVFQTNNRIEVGDTLEADLVASGQFPYSRPKREFYAEVNGKRVMHNREGRIPVEFVASGKGKQYWTGLVRYCDKGTEYTKTFKIPYWVE